MIRLGLFLTNQHPPGEVFSERWRETIEQARLARELGFDMLLFGQHFLSNEFQMLHPSIAAARLAAEAGTMRVGVTIYLLPLLNPVALAEEVASLDIVTGGRFIFGVGLGYREAEDNAFALPKGERVPRFLANLEAMKKLWTGVAVDFESAYCKLRGATTAIRPIQRPHPPVWVAANNDAAVERAAEIGDAWIINPHATLATVGRQMALFRTVRLRTGKGAIGEVPLLRETCAAETRTAALALARPHLERKYGAYVAWGQHKVLPGGDDMAQSFEELQRDRFVIGDPGECVEELRRSAEATGATTIIVRAMWPGMPHSDAMRVLRTIGEKVLPKLG